MQHLQTLDQVPLLQIKGLVKTFDGVTRVVNNVNFEVFKGEIFALLGSSGCGKSTLLRMLAGMEVPTEGEILLEGVNLRNFHSYQRPVNMMFQSYALFPHMTVWDNIAFGLKQEKLPKTEIVQRVEELLTLVQLNKFAKRKPHQLSGGQQQRVALARSLAKRPSLLLLDEPLGALDRKLRTQTQIELVNILHRVGVTCIMVTHDQEEAMTMANRIAVMGEGRFLQVGSAQEVYELPQSRFVADFIGQVNLFDGQISLDGASHAEVVCDDLTLHIDRAVNGRVGNFISIAVRPEKMKLHSTKPDQTLNCVAGKVAGLSYYGAATHYQILLHSNKHISVVSANIDRSRVESDAKHIGDQVWVSWSDYSNVVLYS